jgi:hypothetical protein
MIHPTVSSLHDMRTTLRELSNESAMDERDRHASVRAAHLAHEATRLFMLLGQFATANKRKK